jgi:hypothetical protein
VSFLGQGLTYELKKLNIDVTTTSIQNFFDELQISYMHNIISSRKQYFLNAIFAKKQKAAKK